MWCRAANRTAASRARSRQPDEAGSRRSGDTELDAVEEMRRLQHGLEHEPWTRERVCPAAGAAHERRESGHLVIAERPTIKTPPRPWM